MLPPGLNDQDRWSRLKPPIGTKRLVLVRVGLKLPVVLYQLEPSVGTETKLLESSFVTGPIVAETNAYDQRPFM